MSQDPKASDTLDFLCGCDGDKGMVCLVIVQQSPWPRVPCSLLARTWSLWQILHGREAIRSTTKSKQMLLVLASLDSCCHDVDLRPLECLVESCSSFILLNEYAGALGPGPWGLGKPRGLGRLATLEMLGRWPAALMAHASPVPELASPFLRDQCVPVDVMVMVIAVIHWCPGRALPTCPSPFTKPTILQTV